MFISLKKKQEKKYSFQLGLMKLARIRVDEENRYLPKSTLAEIAQRQMF